MRLIKMKLKELWYYLKAEFIIEQKKRLKIFKHQPRLMIFVVILLYISYKLNYRIYYGTGIYLIFPTPLMIIVLILLSMTNIIEVIYRRIEDVRHVATVKEKEYLLPIYNEVYNKFKTQYSNLSYDIKLYIEDTMRIESFALGKKTIVLSRGIIETMSEEELRGVIAHEFAHIALYHSQVQMIITAILGISIWICIMLEKFFFRLLSTMKTDNIIAVILKVFYMIFAFVINTIMFIANMIIIPNYRNSEYKADRTALKLGFGVQIKEALYKIYDMEITDKKELLKRVYSSHPRTAYRIEKIEKAMK